MRDGFVRVAVGTPEIHVADCEFNANSVIALMEEAETKGVKLLNLPELCLVGCTAQDLMLHDTLIQGAAEALNAVCRASEGKQLIVVVGLPVAERGQLYNCAAVVQGGGVLGVVPKRYPGHAERRYFAPGMTGAHLLKICGMEAPFGTNILFECDELPEFRFAVEIGSDMSAPDSPGTHHALAGATVIAVPAASEEIVGRATFLRQLTSSYSARLACACLYANAGRGESTQDLVFSGHSLIAEKGELLAESKRYASGLTVSEIDLGRIEAERRCARARPGRWTDKGGAEDMTAEFIKQKARELGASICGIGDVELMRGEDPQRNPFSILPNAKCIIGFGVKVPRWNWRNPRSTPFTARSIWIS